MQIRELTIEEFNNFSLGHYLNSFYQSFNYAIVMAEYGYEYEFVGYVDENNEVHAGGLLLHKKLNGINYGYSPRGFLIDYNNKQLVKDFTDALKEYYYDREFAFIKVNPNLKIGTLNSNLEIDYNDNLSTIDFLKENSYTKLVNNKYFESMLPRFDAVINLNNFSTKNLTKQCRNKINKSYKKGLSFNTGGLESLPILYKLMNIDDFYYNDFYNVFSRNEEVEVFTISIDKITYLEISQNEYTKQSDKNQMLNDKMVKKSHKKNINKKMNSDMLMLSQKKDVMEATKLIEEEGEIVIAAALVVNHNGNAVIISSGYDKEYKRFCPNYFLHYNLIKHYQTISNTLNIGGICADLTKESKYYGLSMFKLGFSPTVEENIGEFDLIISEKAYKYLLKNKYIQKEFYKQS